MPSHETDDFLAIIIFSIFFCFLSFFIIIFLIFFYHFSQAAQYWVRLSDVSDKYNSKEHSSELSKNCTALRMFGEQGREGIVTICILASQNFKHEINGINEDTLSVRKNVQDDEYENYTIEEDWDRTQYHGGTVLTAQDCTEARTACYISLLKQISEIKSSPDGRGLGHGVFWSLKGDEVSGVTGTIL